MPSSTGEPGGAKTGDHMADYPISGGNFEIACEEPFSASFKLSWMDRFSILLSTDVTSGFLPHRPPAQLSTRF